MCYHVKTPSADQLKAFTENMHLKSEIDLANYKPYYHVSGFSHPALPVVADNKVQLMQWGLIPFWVKDEAGAKETQNRTLNAVSETIFEKPSFKGSIMKHRCLVLVNGFYEWRDFNKKKYPYFIRLKNDTVACLGGITSSWTDKNTGEIKETFSIVTVAANSMMEQIHNTKKRMPLMLEGEDICRRWMDLHTQKEELIGLMKPAPSHDLDAWTISNRLNHFQKENTNTEDIVERVEYGELPGIG